MIATPDLRLPTIEKNEVVSGSFEVPEMTVKINLRPELAGRLVALLKEAIEAGVDAEWFRPQFESTASTVAETAGNLEYLPDLVEVAGLAAGRGLISPKELTQVHHWAAQASTPTELPPMPPPEIRQRWDEARAQLQDWLDTQGVATVKRLVRQRSLARVTCADCNSMLAYLVAQGEFEFLVLTRGDNQDFEVGHAVGEYGGFTRSRCGRKGGGRKGGRLWVLHADYLRRWLDEGHADVALRHSDKGM